MLCASGKLLYIYDGVRMKKGLSIIMKIVLTSQNLRKVSQGPFDNCCFVSWMGKHNHKLYKIILFSFCTYHYEICSFL